jgi:hypothetical protein
MKSIKLITFLCLVVCFIFMAGGVFRTNSGDNELSYRGGLVVLAEEYDSADVSGDEQGERKDDDNPVAILLAVGFVLLCLVFCIEAIVSYVRKAKRDRDKQFSRE